MENYRREYGKCFFVITPDLGFLNPYCRCLLLRDSTTVNWRAYIVAHIEAPLSISPTSQPPADRDRCPRLPA